MNRSREFGIESEAEAQAEAAYWIGLSGSPAPQVASDTQPPQPRVSYIDLPSEDYSASTSAPTPAPTPAPKTTAPPAQTSPQPPLPPRGVIPAHYLKGEPEPWRPFVGENGIRTPSWSPPSMPKGWR
jgi:hypothetical protein